MPISPMSRSPKRACERSSTNRTPPPTQISAVIFREIAGNDFGPVQRTWRVEDARLEAVTEGPLRSSYTFEGSIGRDTVRVTGHFYPHAERVSFETEIISRGSRGHFLTTVGLSEAGQLFADTHFGVEERDVSKIAYRGMERRLENVFYGSRWVDCSSAGRGLAIVAATGEKGFLFLAPGNSARAHSFADCPAGNGGMGAIRHASEARDPNPYVPVSLPAAPGRLAQFGNGATRDGSAISRPARVHQLSQAAGSADAAGGEELRATDSRYPGDVGPVPRSGTLCCGCISVRIKVRRLGSNFHSARLQCTSRISTARSCATPTLPEARYGSRLGRGRSSQSRWRSEPI